MSGLRGNVPGKSAWGMNAIVAVLANKRLAMQAPARMLPPRPILSSVSFDLS